jgi:ABC-type nitrate/sulfonate/bicarbonate transport system permease component
MNRTTKPLLIQIGSILVFMLIWEIAGRSRLLFEGIVPSIPEIMRAAWAQVSTGFIFPHLFVTGCEAFVGFALALFFGTAAGILLGANPFFRKIFEPLILYFAATPKIILYPIFLMTLGIKFESKMAMAALSGFFPIAINATIAAGNINKIFIKVAKSVGASNFQTFARVYLPSMLLPIVIGMRLGIGVSLVGAILGELKVSNAGLGFIIMDAFNHFRIPEMYGSILLTFLFAAMVNLLMTLILMRVRRFAD